MNYNGIRKLAYLFGLFGRGRDYFKVANYWCRYFCCIDEKIGAYDATYSVKLF